MSRHRPFTLTTIDRSIIEGVLHCEGGPTGPQAFALRRKLDGAMVVPPGEIAPDVATLGSRVKFRLGDGEPEERTLVTGHAEEVQGLTLLAWTPRGLALLGMSAGQQARLLRLDGTPETVTLEAVLYQPESHRRPATVGAPAANAPQPETRVNHLSLTRRPRHPQRVLPDPDGDGDGPSAA